MAATSAAQRLRQIADEIRCLPEAFDDPRDIAREGGLRLYEAIQSWPPGGFAGPEYAVLRVRADWRKKHQDREFVAGGVPKGARCRGISQPGQQYALYLHHSTGEKVAA